MKTFLISEKLLYELLNYLASKPYSEVFGIINQITVLNLSDSEIKKEEISLTDD
ncbi:MAG: hypothetical protein QG635_1420 [Bacteroidota bacterium]|nr:hypothetical protein [Bacteroidota bacterium]